MILKAIKHRLADKTLKKLLQIEQPNISPQAWESVKNIGLIFQADNEVMIKEAEELVGLWENEGKKVQVLMYISDVKKIPLENIKNWLVSTKKDFSFKGVPTSTFICEFIQQPFDLLVDLNVSGQVRLYAISVLSKATFKIGADLFMNKHLPFTVDISGSSESYTIFTLGQELINQLKKIKFA